MRPVSAGVALSLLAAAAGVAAFGRPQDPPPAGEKKQDRPATGEKKQDPPPSPDKLKQDAAEITGTIETWYRVIQDAEPRGYAHETITKVSLVKYQYLFEIDFDYLPKTEGNEAVEQQHISMQVTASLREDFEPTSLVARFSGIGAGFDLQLQTSSDRRYLDLRLGDGGTVSVEIDLASSVLIFEPLTLYRMRQRKDLDKPGARRVNSVRQNGDMAQVAFNVDSAVVREFMGKKDTLVTPVRLVGEAGANEYLVDRYGRVLERRGFYQLSGVRMVATKDADEARGGVGALSARGRRDPFNKFLVLTPIAKVTGPGGEAGPRKLDTPIEIQADKVDETMAQAEGLVRDLVDYVAEGAAKEKEARDTYQKFLRVYEALRPMVIKNAQKLTQLDQLKAQAEKHYRGAEKLLEDAARLLLDIDTQLDALAGAGQDAALKAIEEKIKQMQIFKGRREFINEDDKLGRLLDLIRQAEKKQQQAVARVELSKKRVDLTGVVLSQQIVRDSVKVDLNLLGSRILIEEPAQVLVNDAYAVINEKYYREGDVVEGEGVKVEKIFRQAITISYKEEVREVPLKKEKAK
jgi:hypothetical protein